MNLNVKMKIFTYRRGQILKTEQRKEYKIQCNEFESYQILSYYNNEIEAIFEKRKITNLYFDTLNFEIYKHNVFNDGDKFTIRYRRYNEDNNFTKEIKINNDSGKSKIVKQTKYKDFSEIKNTFYKGHIYYPSVYTQYERSYFKTKHLRITMDENIVFKSSQFRNLDQRTSKFRGRIIEFKLLDGKKNIDILNQVISYPTAFSKFLVGTKSIYRILD